MDLLVALGQDSVEDRIVGTISGFLFFIFNIGTMIGGPLYEALLPGGFKKTSLIAVIIPAFLAVLFVIFTKKMTKSTIAEHPEFEKHLS
ncbi:MAG: hypothetical protein AMDU4_FER2C00201G0003 [Ferroplasma sp. Type II]|uniref:hypothetical protein n=1 Tax=Ferroplasma sp. Type II TaxID=261388 RepID=UPI00038951ED|nr:hypothetical protein [Ferroplasma sp. Type II]EQB71086.1 MAG: hypothetical protein AMDU4_FER2C00201G0003 [Ferroplasma sp. Type II]